MEDTMQRIKEAEFRMTACLMSDPFEKQESTHKAMEEYSEAVSAHRRMLMYKNGTVCIHPSGWL